MKALAKPLHDLLINTDDNISPQEADWQVWYKNLNIIFSFISWILNEMPASVDKITDGTERVDTVMCREMLDAMKYVIGSINAALERELN